MINYTEDDIKKLLYSISRYNFRKDEKMQALVVLCYIYF